MGGRGSKAREEAAGAHPPQLEHSLPAGELAELQPLDLRLGLLPPLPERRAVKALKKGKVEQKRKV